MEFPSRIVAILILTGMILGIFLDVLHEKKKRKRKAKKAAALKLTPGQKAAQIIEQYIDGALGDS